MTEDILESISTAVGNIEDQKVLGQVRRALEAGVDGNQVLESLRKGLEIVGQRYNACEYFLSELIISGEIMKNAMKMLEPYLKGGSLATKGRVVLGSAVGDIHDIGKNIIRTMLASQGYEVHDLGVDVPPSRFVEKAKETGAKVIGISALLSTTVPTSLEVVQLLEKEGLRPEVKVILGGAAVRENMTYSYHVDAAVNSATEGLRIIRSWTA